ncbi:PLP-dependent aminotransferase family protein [Micromonospora cremea]|uniref:GntR family transcriptional regulator / MocR family aminotransferase n=1 Tax=Micromonospora cremea TaxID=709881 RepID=A0A1N5UAR8_9ACTN|nr:PLP-dependent aminotransferase family protein [Micromonospora cremea]SIM57686.1 GntR family transcriptional regulator / MocR family aminotransferase [Micromonospora cremea]
MVESLDLHLEFDRGAGFPGRSLESALRESIRTGRLRAGSRLPGSRSLATDLGLARGTVVRAYAQLVAEGWLVSAPGSGTRVAAVPHDPPGSRREPQPSTVSGPVIELRPGIPDLGSFPRTVWAGSVRRALATASRSALDYTEPTGLPGLRAAVAGYLARTRGVLCDPDAVVITAGFTQGLSLLARALHRRGLRAIATENPGLPHHRMVLRAAGLTVTPLTVGAGGADPDEAAGQAALLTPAHQHPTGVVLAPQHRYRFIAWARKHDAFLIEDDYDGEFRYDQRPVGAMQALAPERIVYAGSTSKSLAPGVRLGWFVVPEPLRRDLAAAILEAGAAVSAIDQLAMADLLTHGEYDRHIRRMRLTYRRRRAELADRLAEVTTIPLEGIAAGMHALLPLASAAQERRLVQAGRRQGLHLIGLHSNGYWHDPADERQAAALVLGYAAPPSHAWKAALTGLAELVHQNSR